MLVFRKILRMYKMNYPMYEQMSTNYRPFTQLGLN